MEKIILGSFNVNGCRDFNKRAQLFDFLNSKHSNVILLQETHSDSSNQSHWQSEWRGDCILSHGSNFSAGVAVLFSPGFGAEILSIEEIIQGWLLKVQIKHAGIFIDFINIYAPNVGEERILFFKMLSQVLGGCSTDHFLVVGGDFNCTMDFNKDRNHGEPHPQSVRELATVLNTFDLVDIWRIFHPTSRQYTWIKCNQKSAVRGTPG